MVQRGERGRGGRREGREGGRGGRRWGREWDEPGKCNTSSASKVIQNDNAKMVASGMMSQVVPIYVVHTYMDTEN